MQISTVRWVVLSAKYGFIDPDFIIPGNYDVTFDDASTNPISIRGLKEQIKQKGLDSACMQIQELITNGFEYICNQDDLKFFRRRK